MFSFAEARVHMVESQVRTNDVTDPQIQRSIAYRQGKNLYKNRQCRRRPGCL